MAETSTKPYMIRALHEWCTDNGYTPQIVVSVDQNTMVPPAHIRDGQITLNIGLMATKGLVLGNDSIEFQARFNGVTENLYIPVGAVTALYARETGAGMGFEVEEPSADNTPAANASTASFAAGVKGQAPKTVQPQAASSPEAADPKRPTLTIVK
ncbi:MAG: ClpXP protease specificity-enhancing factor [Alcaligenaceae bacterium]